jgi:hypothetical protein
MKNFQDALSRKRRSLEVSFNGPFLSDRSPIDSFLYALSGVARDPDSQEWLRQYYSECLRHVLESYQLLILVPHGKISSKIVSDGVRSTLWFNALMMHYLFVGAVQEFRVDCHTLKSISIEWRVDEVLQLLHDRGLIEGTDG